MPVEPPPVPVESAPVEPVVCSPVEVGGTIGGIPVPVGGTIGVWSVVGAGIGPTSVTDELSLPVVPSAELSSSLQAGPDSDKSNAPTAGRTSAGPSGGGVGRTLFEAMRSL